MSALTAGRFAEQATDAAASIVWSQWSALNPQLLSTDTPPATSLIDPEALLLGSLALLDSERRLADVLGWWAERGSTLLSVQRTTTLAAAFPEDARERLGGFAALAVQAGDRRWQRHAGASWPRQPRAGKGPPSLRLCGAATLMLRLRAAMGVGAKVDVLTFLLCRRGATVPVKDISRALGYAPNNVRAAARDLQLAGWVDATDERRAEFGTRPGFAERFMALSPADDAVRGGPPAWQYWAQILACLTSVAAADETAAQPYLLSSALRDLFGRFRWAFRANGIALPDPADYPGADYLPAFDMTIDAVAGWSRMAL